MTITLNPIQADIIFKALHYACRHEGVTIPDELHDTFKVLSESNPYETNVTDCIDVMDQLNGLIRNSEEYCEWFEDENEDDD